MGQYLPREPLMSGVYDLQANLLKRLGLFNDAEERAHDVLRQLQDAFAASGHSVSLTPGWVKAMKTEKDRAGRCPGAPPTKTSPRLSGARATNSTPPDRLPVPQNVALSSRG